METIAEEEELNEETRRKIEKYNNMENARKKVTKKRFRSHQAIESSLGVIIIHFKWPLPFLYKEEEGGRGIGSPCA